MNENNQKHIREKPYEQEWEAELNKIYGNLDKDFSEFPPEEITVEEFEQLNKEDQETLALILVEIVNNPDEESKFYGLVDTVFPDYESKKIELKKLYALHGGSRERQL